MFDGKDKISLERENSGRIYPELVKNMKKYVHVKSDIIYVLEKLRDEGKILFFLTNS